MAESLTTEHARLLRKLKRAPERRETGLVLVEGEVLLGEALSAGLAPRLVAAVEELLSCDAVADARAKGAEVVRLPERRVNEVTERKHGPGLAAAVERPVAWDGSVPATGRALVVALCGLQDPGNVGMLLRTAHAFGAAGALLLPGTADPLAPKVVRASAGSVMRLPLATIEAVELAAWASQRTLQPVSAAVGAPPADLPDRALLLLGHETRGVPDVAGAETVGIAHEPGVDSLNVHVAGAILMSRWYAG